MKKRKKEREIESREASKEEQLGIFSLLFSLRLL